MNRVPVRQFGLHQHSGFIGGDEGRLRRAVTVETNAVHPVRPVFFQDVSPGIGIRRDIACFRKHGAVGFAPQENAPSVQGQMSVQGCEITDAEGNGPTVKPFRADGQGIQIPFPQIPAADFRRQQRLVPDFTLTGLFGEKKFLTGTQRRR